MSIENGEKLTIVDLRTPELFAKSHIPGAINLKFEELDKNLDKLSKDKTTVVYCYDIVCHLSAKAALELAKKGYKVKELEGGYDSWTERNLRLKVQVKPKNRALAAVNRQQEKSMKKFNVTLLSLAAITFVGTSILPAVAGGGCCGAKKEKAQGEDCSKDKAKAEAKGDEKAADTAKNCRCCKNSRCCKNCRCGKKPQMLPNLPKQTRSPNKATSPSTWVERSQCASAGFVLYLWRLRHLHEFNWLVNSLQAMHFGSIR